VQGDSRWIELFGALDWGNRVADAARQTRTCPDYTKLCIFGRMLERLKPVEFRGSSLGDLRAFPPSARQQAGYQLDRLQRGRDPDDWKPMPTVGTGLREIRIRDTIGAFRVLYVARFAEAIYVLHCFQKKTAKTSRIDIATAQKRLKDLLKERAP